MSIRLVLIDDEDTLHHAIEALLRNATDIALVGQAFRGEDALGVCRSVKPDVILMDVKMQGISGVEATRDILQEFPGVKILAHSNFREHEQVKAMLNVGAVGYIAKGSEAEDLFEAIRLTHRGRSILTRDAMSALISPPPIAPADFSLTDRELEVLKLMSSGRNNRQAAQTLGISVATVRFHLVNIQDKLGVHSRSEALIVAAKHHLI